MGTTVRLLAENETMELTEGPLEEKSEVIVRIRGRAVSDGSIGWLTMKSDSLRRWSPMYRCVQEVPINDGPHPEKAAILRQLGHGEVIELLEGPTRHAETGKLRMKGRAESDSAIGWVT